VKPTIRTIGLLAGLAISGSAFAESDVITFKLVPNPKFEACLAVPNGPAPTATAIVVRGKLNDTLTLRVKNIRPNLAFDLFTVQRTSLLATGLPDPTFNGDFGLAWYQSDVEVNKKGDGEVTIKTILLDQIFGFDPLVSLPPTNTFHLGFWFNDPNDAAPCGFDITNPTPFNGEHNAGPLAMISLPDPGTGLGPLCTNPGPNGTCNP